jgi:serine/threonine protein kinase/WD40 repeat protein
MSAPEVCPECGSVLRAEAPGGLCPKCLMAAAVARSRTAPGDELTGAGDDVDVVFGPFPAEPAGARPKAPVSLDEFRRAAQELGLIPAFELERFVAAAKGGVPDLARALVRAGKLTPYQAGALSQGKARGLLIGNYFILDKLGAGGMGVVFKARHRRLGRIVALKILPPTLARDKDLLSRFRREVDVAARLSHPNIVSVLDANEDRGVQFMTMEYIEGNDLDRLVRHGGVLPVDQALDCVIQAARGLEAAHAQGIVHRDIKPANLMIDGSGTLRVLDLGLARLVEASNPFSDTAAGPLTRSGTYMGTIDFMAPEQGVDSRRVDHRADIYSLGCTLCYLLTGRPPFDGSTVLARLMAHQERSPSSLLVARPDLPASADAVYLTMMAKKPGDRPASMSEVIEQLSQCRSSSRAQSAAAQPLPAVPARSIATNPASAGIVVRNQSPDPAERTTVALGNHGLPTVPAGQTLIERSIRIPPQTKTVGRRKLTNRGSLALALGAFTLLATLGAGFVLFPRQAGRPQPGSAPPPVAPRSLLTFSVVTLYITHDYFKNDASVETLAVTADGQRALVGSWAEYCELVDISTGAKVQTTLGAHDGWQGGRPTVAISPNGRRGLIGTQSVLKENLERIDAAPTGILWCWDLWTGNPVFPKQQPYDGPVIAVAVSPDGLHGLSASGKGELILWDLTTGEPTRWQPGPNPSEVSQQAIAFFPDGRRAATAGSDRLVHIWDVSHGTELTAWKGQDTTITSLAISHDGTRIVTGGDDSAVILWDVARGEIVKRFELPPNDSAAHVAFDSDDNVVAAGSGMDDSPDQPGNLIVWHAESPYEELGRDERPFARHMAVATLPGGRVLTGDRYALRLWTPRRSTADTIPPKASPVPDTSPVNLLALITPQTYRIGKWEMPEGALESPPHTRARLQLPYSPPPEYKLDFEVEQLAGKESDYKFAIGLVVAGRQVEIGVDHLVDDIGKCTGFAGLDGAPFQANPNFHRGQLLSPGHRVRLSVTVGRDSINLTCDGSNVLDWNGDPKRFIPYKRWNIPDSDKLFLCSGSAVKFHEITLTPLPQASP